MIFLLRHYGEELRDGRVPLVLLQGSHLGRPTSADEMGEITFPPRGHEVGHPVYQGIIWIGPVALFRSSHGGLAPSPPFLRSPG